jgi:hypothetical protein
MRWRAALALFGGIALLGAQSMWVARTARGQTSESTVGLSALRQGDLLAASNTSRYGYVILQSWDWGNIAALRAANPSVRVLVYKNMLMSSEAACQNGTDSAYLPAGVGYCYANTYHPEWFLTDTTGARLSSPYWPYLWLMDIGNPAYQQAWLANVTTDATSHGWDGVFLDDASQTTFQAGAATVSAYPTNSQWLAANDSFLRTVEPALVSRGLLAYPNINLPNFDSSSEDTFVRWAGLGSGAFFEFWMKWGDDDSSPLFSGAEWSYLIGIQQAVESEGKDFLTSANATVANTTYMAYARASFLMAWNGTARSVLVFRPSTSDTDPWSPAWTTDIGTPSGSPYPVGSAWRRDYSGGTTIVNASSSSTTVPLGATYITTDGAALSSVNLAPETGMVLRSAPGVPSTSSTPSTQSSPTTYVGPDGLRHFFFAEGYTGQGFDEYLTIQNAGTDVAPVTVTYLFPAGPPILRTYLVQPSSRSTVRVNDEVGPGREVAVVASSPGQVMMERAMYFLYHGTIDGGSALAPLPAPRTDHYYAEGYTGPGFDEYLTIQNAGIPEAHLNVSYLFPDGTSITRSYSVAGSSRTTIVVANEIGRGKEVSLAIHADLPVVTERVMYFTYGSGITGGSATSGLDAPRTSLLFAEGYTGPGFDEYMTLSNPSGTPAHVELAYHFSDGTSAVSTHMVAAHSRATVRVEDEVGPGRELATSVSSDIGVVAERAMYFRHNGIDGGSATVGTPEGSNLLHFAEGYTGPGFEEYLTFYNPGSSAVSAAVTFQFGAGAAMGTTLVIPGGSRHTLNVNDLVGPDREVSALVTSSGELVVERPMYFRYHGTITGGSSVMGA